MNNKGKYDHDRTQLTENENKVWALRCQGQTNAQIAEALGISKRNVEQRMSSIRARMKGKEAQQK